jgi:hypothetical protein
VLLPLAAAGFVVLGRRHIRRWPLAVPVVLASVTAVLTYGNQRFHAGATPAIAVLAATAIVAATRRVVHR